MQKSSHRNGNYRQNTWTLEEARSTFQQQMADYARGEKLRELRSARGLSQEEVAAALGVTAKTYGAWERGGGIHVTNAKRIARYFKVKPGELVAPDIQQEPPATVLSEEDSERLRKIEERLEELDRKLDRLLTPSEDDPQSDDLEDAAQAVGDAIATARPSKRAPSRGSRANRR